MTIDRAQLSQLSPARRAELIYTSAQSELARNLWRAAIGASDSDGATASNAVERTGKGGFDRMLALFTMMQRHAADQAQPDAAGDAGEFGAVNGLGGIDGDIEESSEGCENLSVDALGPNARFGAAIERAAGRTGIPAPALASIIDAEAGKGHDGSWNCHSRNPRSSAAGLGQFLSGTWESEAERKGTWLNEVAAQRGWLDSSGRVAASARSSLLSLRYDPESSINAIADYASRNLSALRSAGVHFGDGAEGIAKAAYLGHHLGSADAAHFLKGGLASGRARLLLNAQIGSAGANRLISETGNATAAHREWLLSYVDRRIRPERFAA